MNKCIPLSAYNELVSLAAAGDERAAALLRVCVKATYIPTRRKKRRAA